VLAQLRGTALFYSLLSGAFQHYLILFSFAQIQVLQIAPSLKTCSISGSQISCFVR
jgi:hypothetical protein